MGKRCDVAESRCRSWFPTRSRAMLSRGMEPTRALPAAILLALNYPSATKDALWRRPEPGGAKQTRSRRTQRERPHVARSCASRAVEAAARRAVIELLG